MDDNMFPITLRLREVKWTTDRDCTGTRAIRDARRRLGHRRVCLRCNRSFPSTGPGNRICIRCSMLEVPAIPTGRFHA